MSRDMWKQDFPHQYQRTLACLGLILLAIQSGCAVSRQGLTGRFRPDNKPWVLSSTSTREQIVSHINQQRLGLEGWQSTDAEVKFGLLPVTSAMIAVESPDRFRIRVANPLTGVAEVDLGANQDRVWSYVREVQPPMLHTVSKTDFDEVCDQYGSPIDMDWIMEALLVKPLDAEQLSLEQVDASGQKIALVKRSFLADGRELQQKTIVDRKAGTIERIVLSDANGEVYARAELSDYAMAQPGKLFPHKIKLGMPSVPMSKHLSLTLKTVRVNPEHHNDVVFQMPQLRDVQVVQIQQQHLQQMASSLGLINRQQQGSTRPVTEYEFNEQGTIARTDFTSNPPSHVSEAESMSFNAQQYQTAANTAEPWAQSEMRTETPTSLQVNNPQALPSTHLETPPWMAEQNFEPVQLPEFEKEKNEPEWVKAASGMAKRSLEAWQPSVNEQPFPANDPFGSMTPAKPTATPAANAEPFSPFYQHQSPWGDSMPANPVKQPSVEGGQPSGRSTIDLLGS